MSTKIDSLWDSINLDKTGVGFRRFDATHILDFYVGIDSDGRRALLLICPSEPVVQSDMRAVLVKSHARDDGRWSLFIVLEDIRLVELFSLFCEDLIESSRFNLDLFKSFAFVVSRLTSWRQLFELGDLGLLSENQVRGLCGELLYLRTLVESIGALAAVNAWVGPSRADQDFQVENHAWEIKTIRPGCDVIKISSEEQLDTKLRSIDLVVIELGNCTVASQGAFTLNSMVCKIQSLLMSNYEARLKFDNLLFKAGYIVRPEYDVLNLVVRNVAVFSVCGDFPRIAPHCLPVGVSRVKYELNLAECVSFKTT
ncbi:PD-(D/E)XK motif protein [Pseudomonas sp. MPC6]|uniref:PD-(D/E)XK motif protein n=1 Tax=unclassified Pseudomonas TaxID=196821 RepID=UPI0013754F01|nr:PD-(D/E)XK motif protein [Pseudomonas sp. MPC6]